jgi:competence/damage-inducible protein CinA-like protein
MKAEIISIGRELLMGETVDTNASFLAKQLPLLGIDLVWVSQVGDVQAQIVEVLQRAWNRSDLVMTTGGLGPTGDDLTRESIAELMSEKMVLVPELEKSLRERFLRFGTHQMPESNLKQCTLIPSASAIPNPQGTAPGWWIERDGRILVCMPGPPREMHDMWEKSVRRRLEGRSGRVILARTWKTSGYSEAAVGEMSFPLFPTDNPSLGVYAKQDGIHLQLKVTAQTVDEAARLLSAGESRIMQVFGSTIWGTDDETLETAVGKILTAQGKSLGVMEDYTSGLLTASLADVENSLSFLKGGVTTVSDEAKIVMGVPAAALSRGSVNAEVAVAMAEAARARFGADIGIGISGTQPAQAGGAVHYAISDGTVREAMLHPRGKERLATTVLFELRKLLLSVGGQGI